MTVNTPHSSPRTATTVKAPRSMRVRADVTRTRRSEPQAISLRIRQRSLLAATSPKFSQIAQFPCAHSEHSARRPDAGRTSKHGRRHRKGQTNISVGSHGRELRDARERLRALFQPRAAHAQSLVARPLPLAPVTNALAGTLHTLGARMLCASLSRELSGASCARRVLPPQRVRELEPPVLSTS